MVASLPARAEAINSDEHYVYWIARVAIFGSFLSDRELLGDLDVAIQLKARELPISPARFAKFEEDFPPPAYIRHNWFERQFWSQTKLRRDFTLRRLMRVHDFAEMEALECDYRVIFERGVGVDVGAIAEN